MGPHELSCFERTLAPAPVTIEVFDLLSESLRPERLQGVDLVLMGGSGAYSVVGHAPWLDTALESLRTVHASGVPAFASCWGFQGMALAMGGQVAHDVGRAEVGTHELVLTDAGEADPLFAYLGSPFKAQMGHEDLVEALPPCTTLLASSGKVTNQAYRFDDAPIYCTQFHPELGATELVHRLANYPKYVEKVAGMSMDELRSATEDTPRTAELVRRFVDLFVEAPPGL